jgi:hypothetical protein
LTIEGGVISGPAFYFFWEFTLHTLIYTSAFEGALPHIVVISLEPDINVSGIDGKSATPPKYFALFLSGCPKMTVPLT